MVTKGTMFNARTLLASIATFAALSLPFAAPAFAADSGSALETFKARHSAVVELVKHNAEDAKLQGEVDKLLNYKVLAEKSLGGATHYQERCAPKCDEFEQLLTELIRRNYLDRIRTNTNYEVEYIGEEAKEKYTKVLTRVKYENNGRPESVEVIYKMAKTEDGVWMAIDLSTDGVSLGRTYKHEFKQLHQEGGIELLVSKLKRQLDELKAKGK